MPRKKRKGFYITDRELQVMKMICMELTSKEIAGKIGLSARTVEDYRDNLITKLKVKNVIGVVKYAIKNRIYPLKIKDPLVKKRRK